MIGTRAMSGSAATRFRNSTIARLRVEQAFVHVDVDDLRAVRHLIARHFKRGGVVARGDQLAEFRRARDIGALADIDEGNVVRQRERLEPREPQQRRDFGNLARADALRPTRRWRLMCVGRRAAAAAQNIDEVRRARIRRRARPYIPGSRRRAPNSLGRPALGKAQTRVSATRPISAMCWRISRAPSAQLKPIEKGWAWASEFQKACGVWPDSVRPERSVIVPEIMIGNTRADLVEGVFAARKAPPWRSTCRRSSRRAECRRRRRSGRAPPRVGGAQLVEPDGAKAGIGDVRRDRRGAVGRADRARRRSAQRLSSVQPRRRPRRASRAPSRLSS